MDWGNPINARTGAGNWEYNSADEREACAGALVERLLEVVELMDALGTDPDILVRAVLHPDSEQLAGLRFMDHHLRHPSWRAAVLIRRGPSAALESALAEGDAFPALRLRAWVSDYMARFQHR